MSFEVGVAPSGEEALVQLDRAADAGQPYDLVIMDYKMPGLDGIEVTRRVIKKSGPDKAPTVIMVTAYGREEIMKQAEDAGAKAFLIKPVNQSVLLNTIMETFGQEKRRAFHPLTAQAVSVEAMAAIRGARLLVAEDNEINQQVAREILESAGLRVDLANNGKEALEKARAHPYDGVLMDIQMPELDGLQAAAELRRDSRFAHLPIIAMTAHAMAGDRERSLAVGMNDHVTKPIDPDALFTVLLRWVRRSGPEAVDITPPSKLHAATGPAAASPRFEGMSGIDHATGLRRVAGNESLYNKLLLDFHRDYGSSIDRIQAEIAEGRLKDAERQVHTLKGVAGNIGAMKLHGAAEELDTALRLGDLNKSQKVLAEVQRELSRVIRGLQPLADQATAARAETTATRIERGGAVLRTALEAALRTLADLIRKNDPEAEAALEEVRGALNGSRAKEVEHIAQTLDLFDFRGAAKALTALAEAEGISVG